MPDQHTGSELMDFGGLRFTITNGQVSDVARVVGTRTIDLGVPANASFSVGNGSVTETLVRGGATETLTYTADASDATLYHLTQAQRSFDTSAAKAPTFGFTLSNGVVTAMTESVGASGKTHTIDLTRLPATSFTASAGGVTETTVHGNTIETLKFTTTDGSAYKLASDTESVVAAGTATTRLDVEPGERMRFTFSGDTVTAAQAVKADGSSVTLASHTGVSFTQLAPGYVVETLVHGTQSAYEVFHDGNGDGIYTAVAHGSGTTVDLVGLQAQISPLIHSLV